ncbi:MAG: hypothetical protein LBI33_12890 [Propionibacteriaceae bacterium]|jgi:hypothetical protein|nr:hypothetical protein [Propionibacteriaceae bacterium]
MAPTATTYPVEPGSLTREDALYLLSRPNLIGERVMKAMGDDMFPVATTLLAGRAQFVEGVIVITPNEAPIAADGVGDVAPGAEYPETTLFSGDSHTAESLKRGYKVKITDEALSRNPFGITNTLNAVFTFLGNGMKVDFERLCTAAVGSAPVPAYTASPWDTTKEDGLDQMAEDVVGAYEQILTLDKGFAPTRIVVTPAQWAKIARLLTKTKELNPLQTNLPLNPWDPSAYFVARRLPKAWQPTLVDPAYFGGIAHETIDSEGEYAAVGAVPLGFEVASWRDPGRKDTRWVQCRKTDSPYLWNPDAALTLTGTGL